MDGTLGLVVNVWMGLGRIVGKIVWAGAPKVSELALGFSASEPPKSHVHGFHPFGNDGFVGYAEGSCVVCLDG